MKRSAWWFLLPIFLGILGSAIAWAKLRESEDHELLKWIMIFGAIQTIAIALSGMYNSFGWPDNIMTFHMKNL